MDDGFTTRLGAGQAMTLRAQRAPRRLVVTHGRLWLTLQGGGDDHWLDAGQALTLPAGCAAVAEGWPTAAFQLLQPAAALPRVAPMARLTLAARG